MSVDHSELRQEAPEPSVWRLGDILHELLGQYGLDEACSLPEGTMATCGEAGLFTAADLPAAAASAY